jgi:ActR/RegA family two-component response regulator
MDALQSSPLALIGLNAEELAIIHGVKAHSERLLDHSARFKFFTLHGAAHLNSLFEILNLLRAGGITLRGDQLFLLAIAICIHDLGMVVALRDREIREILDGKPGFPDATALEQFVRDRHHELVDNYLSNDVSFLLGLGVTPPQIAQARDIARCHRKVFLQQQPSTIRELGALLRVIDELDIGPRRAPADVLLNGADEMDATSCWHWFKHNIVEPWSQGHTVKFIEENERKRIIFRIIALPTRIGSIGYWLTQIRRPIAKALFDDGARNIIYDSFGVTIDVETCPEDSRVNNLGDVWKDLEEKALSANRRVILVIDDEVRKLEDLFLPLMDNYHVVYSYNAKDAISKLDAGGVDLAIVDMQIGAGGLWQANETDDFKTTGVKLCDLILKNYPKTRVAVLTGTRHSIDPIIGMNLGFICRKPIDPDDLIKRINDVLT